MASGATPASRSETATTMPVRSLPAAQCTTVAPDSLYRSIAATTRGAAVSITVR